MKHLLSSLWGHICEDRRIFRTIDQVIDENMSVSTTYNVECEYYIKDVHYRKNCDEVLQLIHNKNPYYLSLARLKSFLLARGRYLTAKIALLYLDDVVRIHTDGIVFNKPHDDVMTKYKTFPTLCKEDKTTGQIKWSGVNKYETIS